MASKERVKVSLSWPALVCLGLGGSSFPGTDNLSFVLVCAGLSALERTGREAHNLKSTKPNAKKAKTQGNKKKSRSVEVGENSWHISTGKREQRSSKYV